MPRSAHLIKTSTTASNVQADLETHCLHRAHRFNSIHMCYLYPCNGVKTLACLVKFSADDLKENILKRDIDSPGELKLD